jgi:hypothetical protein
VYTACIPKTQCFCSHKIHFQQVINLWTSHVHTSAVYKHIWQAIIEKCHKLQLLLHILVSHTNVSVLCSNPWRQHTVHRLLAQSLQCTEAVWIVCCRPLVTNSKHESHCVSNIACFAILSTYTHTHTHTQHAKWWRHYITRVKLINMNVKLIFLTVLGVWLAGKPHLIHYS